MSFKLASISKEQQSIVDNIIKGNNVIVDSVAGSGKTTTCLHVCMNVNKKVLLLTYNSRLKIESRQKVRALGLKNVEVHSYHAFCVKYYYNKGYRDDGIQEILDKKFSPKSEIAFDIVILDEQQDMTMLFYRLIKKIINDNVKKNVQMCAFGDIYQNIYTYAGSDSRYLLYAQKIFGGNNWNTLKITTSYRVTKQIASFVNVNLLKMDRLKAIKNGPNVKYIITDSFKDKCVYDEIMKYFGLGYLPEDIFVLGASLKIGKHKSPICTLENKLVAKGIACHTSSDDEKVDNDVIQGKVCFASFHQVKGMERKICIVYGFDDSYFTFYAKNSPKDVCPNVLYVAVTRASERLVLIHDRHNEYFSFIDKDMLIKTCDVIIKDEISNCVRKDMTKCPSVMVGDLVKNLSNEAINHIFKFIKYRVVKCGKEELCIQSKVMGKHGLCENVMELNALAIPAMCEFNYTKKITMIELMLGHINGVKAIGIGVLPEHHTKIFRDVCRKYVDGIIGINDVLYVANLYHSLLTGYIGKREQIVNYSWLGRDQTVVLVNIMKKYVSCKTEYEKVMNVHVCGKKLIGVIDAVDDEVLWEFKCGGELLKENVLRLVLCSYLWEKNNKVIDKLNAMIEYEHMIEIKKGVELVGLCKVDGIDLYKVVDVLGNKKKVRKNKAEMIVSLIENYQKKIDCVKKCMKYKLLNILTEEIIEVEYSNDYEIVVDYLLNMNNNKKIENDDDFIKRCVGL